MNGAEQKNVQLVKVYIRQRPFTKNETELRRPTSIHGISSNEILLRSGSQEKKYTFDRVFCKNSTQTEVYNVVVFPLIDLVLSGYTCTVFAYGQTGTGKTYTMIGENIPSNTDFVDDPSVGMVPRAALHLFSALDQLSVEYTVTVSFVEIYNEEVRDLLVREGTPLRVYDDPDSKNATCIKGLTEKIVANTNDVYDLLLLGTMERQTASTNLNRHSSRSHTIFTLVVNTKESTMEGEEIIKTGKLHLTDLAGSENIGRSGATEMRAREAGTINKSLLTLGKVIKALAHKSPHVPYRESKLTRILQDSLGGKSKTCMIATFSPCVDAFDETVSTLDYAYVARSVANCPTVTINKNQRNVLKTSQEEVVRLRHELEAARAGQGFYMNSASYAKINDDIKANNARVSTLLKEINHLESHISEKQHHFDELDRSYQRTSIDATAVKKKLRKIDKKEKKADAVINNIHGKLLGLSEVSNILYNVCESSTKHEDIYHQKYQTQCQSTLYNAEVANDIYTSATASLREIQNSSDNFSKGQAIHLEDGKRRVHLLQENQSENLEELNLLSAEMESTSKSHNLTFDSLFTDKAYGQTQIETQLGSLYGESCDFQFGSLEKVKNNLENVRDYMFEKAGHVEVEAARCLPLVDEAEAEDIAHSTRSDELLQNLYTSMQNKQATLERKLAHVRAVKESYAAIIEAAELKMEEEDRELEAIRYMKEVIDETLLHEKNATKPLLKMQETLIGFNESLNPMEAVPELVQNAVEAIEENENMCQKKIEASLSKSERYLLEFSETLTNKLSHHSQEIKDTLTSWDKTLKTISTSLVQTTEEHNEVIESHLEHLSAAGETHHSDVKQFLQKSKEDLNNLEQDLDSVVHAGDTPIKPVYEYPKNLENHMAATVLLELDETLDDSRESL